MRKLFLPSVDRPWPLSSTKAEVYGFRPTPLKDVLQSCHRFFLEGCVTWLNLVKPGETLRLAVR